MNSSKILHPDELSRKWMDKPVVEGVTAADIHSPEEFCFLNGKAVNVRGRLNYG